MSQSHTELAALLRETAQAIRRKPMPLADFIPLLQQAADALESPERVQRETTKQMFNRLMQDDVATPLERLTFFCSLAMSGQDWLDSEPFFAALEAALSHPSPAQGWQPMDDGTMKTIMVQLGAKEVTSEGVVFFRKIEDAVLKVLSARAAGYPAGDGWASAPPPVVQGDKT